MLFIQCKLSCSSNDATREYMGHPLMATTYVLGCAIAVAFSLLSCGVCCCLPFWFLASATNLALSAQVAAVLRPNHSKKNCRPTGRGVVTTFLPLLWCGEHVGGAVEDAGGGLGGGGLGEGDRCGGDGAEGTGNKWLDSNQHPRNTIPIPKSQNQLWFAWTARKQNRQIPWC